MFKAKIIGAGSIGNHLANACRSREWDVTVCDVDKEALERMQKRIYPGRYGRWDEAIRLFQVKDAPKREFPKFAGRRSVSVNSDVDLILIATAHDDYKSIDFDRLGIPVVDTRHILSSKNGLVLYA
jgi:UDP-N-acetyl-D-mannosaminuronate dehydrogenase